MLLRVGYRSALLLGAVLVVAGSAMCLRLGADTPLAYAVLAVFVIGLGMGFSSTGYLVSVQNAVPWHRRGIATSSVVFFRTIGGSLGVAVMGTILNLSLGDRYRAAVERAAGGDGALARLLSDPNALLQPALRARIPEEAYGELAAALAAALSPAFWVVAALAVAALVVSMLFPAGRAEDFMKREPLP